jgi:hypothetical protein
MMSVERTEMKLLRPLNQIRANAEPRPIRRLQVLYDGEMGIIPGHREQSAGRLFVPIGQGISFFRRFGAGVAMYFYGRLDTQFFRIDHQLFGEPNRKLGWRIVVGKLDVDVMGARGLLLSKQRCKLCRVPGRKIATRVKSGWSANFLCFGVSWDVKPSKPASFTARNFRSNDHSFFLVRCQTSVQRLAM